MGHSANTFSHEMEVCRLPREAYLALSSWTFTLGMTCAIHIKAFTSIFITNHKHNIIVENTHCYNPLFRLVIKIKAWWREHVRRMYRNSNILAKLWENESQHSQMNFNFGSWNPTMFQIFETKFSLVERKRPD
jgi:hypothetical protein